MRIFLCFLLLFPSLASANYQKYQFFMIEKFVYGADGYSPILTDVAIAGSNGIRFICGRDYGR